MTSPTDVSIEAVVFDFGGVFTVSPFLHLTRAVRDKGVADVEAGLLQVFGDYRQDGDHPWHRLERGEVTFMDARAEIMATSAESIGVELDIIELFASFAGDGSIRSDVVDLASAVGGSGRKVAMLTNNLAEFGSRWRAMLPVDDLFSEVVDSSAVGMRKPDPAIYRLTQERLGVDEPSTVLFLDDAEGNVESAREVGWQAILVEEDHRVQVRQVRSLLGI